MLAAVLGARVRSAETPEIGWLPVRLEPAARDDRLFYDLPTSFVTCVWHGDMFDLPPGAVSLARSEKTPCQAFRYGTNVYGLLFHLEMQPNMVAACVSAFESRLRKAGIDPAHCLAEAEGHLARLAPVAETVFGRWANMVLADNEATPRT
jgi:GMP synthase (glutamine-hydrolysing)